MTDQTVSAPFRADVARGGAFYRLVWKWHFLASLYVLPFMLILSITGGIYLFKPQIEEIIYESRLNVEVTGEPHSLEMQQAAVMAAFPGSRIDGITTEQAPGRATVFTVKDQNRVKSYVWVNPYTAEILENQERNSTMMRMLKKFHGELLLGDVGTKFVELSAHWAIVMMITGVYMWWPRGKRTWPKVFSLPSNKGRAWWREVHMFTGILAFVLIFPLLLTGLPWTDVWGGGFSFIQEQTGQKSPSLRFGGKPVVSSASEGEAITYAQVIETARVQGMTLPYTLRPPKNADATYWVGSATRDRFARSEMVIDQYNGEVLKTVSFADFPILAKAVSLGIGFHQGELYGWTNIIQNVIASVLGVILSISGFVAWWSRRPAGELGVPAAPQAVLSWGMIALVVALSILLPLMGASLVLALVLDWAIFKRLGWFQGPKLKA